MSKTAAACLSVAVMGLIAPMGRWLRAVTHARLAQRLTPVVTLEDPRFYNQVFQRS